MMAEVSAGSAQYSSIKAEMVSYTYIHHIMYEKFIEFVNRFRVIIRFIMYIHCILVYFIHKIKENCCF